MRTRGICPVRSSKAGAGGMGSVGVSRQTGSGGMSGATRITVSAHAITILTLRLAELSLREG